MTWSRDNPWRQGSLVPLAAAREAIADQAEIPDESFVILISHDCDIATDDLSEEPFIEAVIACRVAEVHPHLRHAQHPRKLHLPIGQRVEEFFVEVTHASKIQLKKEVLGSHAPLDSPSLTRHSREILRSWLIARYGRAAFPNALESRLGRIKDKFLDVAKSRTKAIDGIFLRVDPEIELPDGEPYEIDIAVVFDPHEPEAQEQSERVAARLHDAIERKFYKDGTWTDIHLVQSVAISNEEFSLAMLKQFSPWRLEHLSFRTDPPGSLPPKL